MISKGELSEHFSRVIPKNVIELAEQEYQNWDRQQKFSDVQSDIARKLLKLRVSFQENVTAVPDISYYADFKLTEVNKGNLILLQGDKNSNTSTGEWLG